MVTAGNKAKCLSSVNDTTKTIHHQALTKTRNDLKQLETTYNEQETTWNDLQRPEKTYNEHQTTLKQPTTSKKQPEITHNE